MRAPFPNATPTGAWDVLPSSAANDGHGELEQHHDYPAICYERLMFDLLLVKRQRRRVLFPPFPSNSLVEGGELEDKNDLMGPSG